MPTWNKPNRSTLSEYSKYFGYRFFAISKGTPRDTNESENAAFQIPKGKLIAHDSRNQSLS